NAVGIPADAPDRCVDRIAVHHGKQVLLACFRLAKPKPYLYRPTVDEGCIRSRRPDPLPGKDAKIVRAGTAYRITEGTIAVLRVEIGSAHGNAGQQLAHLARDIGIGEVPFDQCRVAAILSDRTE